MLPFCRSIKVNFNLVLPKDASPGAKEGGYYPYRVDGATIPSELSRIEHRDVPQPANHCDVDAEADGDIFAPVFHPVDSLRIREHRVCERGGPTTASPCLAALRRYIEEMIYTYDNASQTKWDRGEHQVQLMVPTQAGPIGFCDGTDADIAELRSVAESEGAESFEIQRKTLKSGREIWTLLGASGEADNEAFD